eukprot:Nk52_evm44s2449 gene=Nk52_evmTU44s2449
MSGNLSNYFGSSQGGGGDDPFAAGAMGGGGGGGSASHSQEQNSSQPTVSAASYFGSSQGGGGGGGDPFRGMQQAPAPSKPGSGGNEAPTVNAAPFQYQFNESSGAGDFLGQSHGGNYPSGGGDSHSNNSNSAAMAANTSDSASNYFSSAGNNPAFPTSGATTVNNNNNNSNSNNNAGSLNDSMNSGYSGFNGGGSTVGPQTAGSASAYFGSSSQGTGVNGFFGVGGGSSSQFSQSNQQGHSQNQRQSGDNSLSQQSNGSQISSGGTSKRFSQRPTSVHGTGELGGASAAQHLSGSGNTLSQSSQNAAHAMGYGTGGSQSEQQSQQWDQFNTSGSQQAADYFSNSSNTHDQGNFNWDQHLSQGQQMGNHVNQNSKNETSQPEQGNYANYDDQGEVVYNQYSQEGSVNQPNQSAYGSQQNKQSYQGADYSQGYDNSGGQYGEYAEGYGHYNAYNRQGTYDEAGNVVQTENYNQSAGYDQSSGYNQQASHFNNYTAEQSYVYDSNQTAAVDQNGAHAQRGNGAPAVVQNEQQCAEQNYGDKSTNGSGWEAQPASRASDTTGHDASGFFEQANFGTELGPKENASEVQTKASQEAPSSNGADFFGSDPPQGTAQQNAALETSTGVESEAELSFGVANKMTIHEEKAPWDTGDANASNVKANESFGGGFSPVRGDSEAFGTDAGGAMNSTMAHEESTTSELGVKPEPVETVAPHEVAKNALVGTKNKSEPDSISENHIQRKGSVASVGSGFGFDDDEEDLLGKTDSAVPPTIQEEVVSPQENMPAVNSKVIEPDNTASPLMTSNVREAGDRYTDFPQPQGYISELSQQQFSQPINQYTNEPFDRQPSSFTNDTEDKDFDVPVKQSVAQENYSEFEDVSEQASNFGYEGSNSYSYAEGSGVEKSLEFNHDGIPPAANVEAHAQNGYSGFEETPLHAHPTGPCEVSGEFQETPLYAPTAEEQYTGHHTGTTHFADTSTVNASADHGMSGYTNVSGAGDGFADTTWENATGNENSKVHTENRFIRQESAALGSSPYTFAKQNSAGTGDSFAGEAEAYQNTSQPSTTGYGAAEYSTGAPSSSSRSPFPKAHPVVSFGLGGKLLVMFPDKKVNPMMLSSANYSQSSAEVESYYPTPITVFSISSVLQNSDYVKSLKAFPGPILGSKSKKNVQEIVKKNIEECQPEGLTTDSPKLIWQALELLLKNDGTMQAGSKSSDAMKNNDPTSMALSEILLNQEEEGTFANSAMSNSFSSRRRVSEAEKESILQKIQKLILSGDRKAACDAAVEGGLWEHALLIASHIDLQVYNGVIEKVAQASLTAGDPLYTLYHLFGQKSEAVMNPENIDTSRWRENVSTLLCNRTKGDVHVIVAYGDKLWQEGSVNAAQFCYLVAGVGFSSIDDVAARLVLLGADHRSHRRGYSSPFAIQRTEVYEFCKTLGNSQFSLPEFQAYKFSYGCRLAEVGMLAEALQYFNSIASILKSTNGRESVGYYHRVFIHQLSEMADRIKCHDPEVESSSGVKKWWDKGFSSLKKTFDSGLDKIINGREQESRDVKSSSSTPLDGPKQVQYVNAISSSQGPAGFDSFGGMTPSSSVASLSGLDSQLGMKSPTDPYDYRPQLYSQYSDNNSQLQGSYGNFSQNYNNNDFYSGSQHYDQVDSYGANQSYGDGSYQYADGSGAGYDTSNFSTTGGQDQYVGYDYSVSGYDQQNMDYSSEGAYASGAAAPLNESSAAGNNGRASIGAADANSTQQPGYDGSNTNKPQMQQSASAPAPAPIEQPNGAQSSEAKGPEIEDELSLFNKKPGTSAKEKESKGEEEGEKKAEEEGGKKKDPWAEAEGLKKSESAGWLTSITKGITNLIPKRPKGAHLGEDVDFHYDPVKKRWVSKSGGEEDDEQAAPPPPSDAELMKSHSAPASQSVGGPPGGAAPPSTGGMGAASGAGGPPSAAGAGNRYRSHIGGKKGKNARSRYVDVFGGQKGGGGVAPAPGPLLAPPLPTGPQMLSGSDPGSLGGGGDEKSNVPPMPPGPPGPP